MRNNWPQGSRSTPHRAELRLPSVVGLVAGALSIVAVLMGFGIGPGVGMLLAAIGLASSIYALKTTVGKGARDYVAAAGLVMSLVVLLLTVVPIMILIIVLGGM